MYDIKTSFTHYFQVFATTLCNLSKYLVKSMFWPSKHYIFGHYVVFFDYVLFQLGHMQQNSVTLKT